jgi:hypothetical protein
MKKGLGWAGIAPAAAGGSLFMTHFVTSIALATAGFILIHYSNKE